MESSLNQKVTAKSDPSIPEWIKNRPRVPKFKRTPKYKQPPPKKRLTPKLKYLSKIIDPPLIQYLRITDFSIPLDSTCLNNNETNRLFHSFLGERKHFKRVISYDYDQLSETYDYQVTERWPSRNKWKGYDNLNYLAKYMNSLGHISAHTAALRIYDWIGYLEKMDKIPSIVFIKNKIEESLTKKRSYDRFDKSPRLYKVKLDPLVIESFNNRPFCRLLENYNMNSYESYLRSFSHNRLIRDLVGLTHIS